VRTPIPPEQGKAVDWTKLLRNGFPVLLTIGVIDSARRKGFLTFLPFLLQSKGAGLSEIGLALTMVFAGGAAGKVVCGFLGAGDPLARTRREPVNIADQGYHDPSPRYCRSGKAIVADPCPGIGRSGGPANRLVRMCFQPVPCIRSPAGNTYAMALAATSAMTASGGNTTLWAMRFATSVIRKKWDSVKAVYLRSFGAPRKIVSRLVGWEGGPTNWKSRANATDRHRHQVAELPGRRFLYQARFASGEVLPELRLHLSNTSMLSNPRTKA
jgi:hypothetical protein